MLKVILVNMFHKRRYVILSHTRSIIERDFWILEMKLSFELVYMLNMIIGSILPSRI